VEGQRATAPAAGELHAFTLIAGTFRFVNSPSKCLVNYLFFNLMIIIVVYILSHVAAAAAAGCYRKSFNYVMLPISHSLTHSFRCAEIIYHIFSQPSNPFFAISCFYSPQQQQQKQRQVSRFVFL